LSEIYRSPHLLDAIMALTLLEGMIMTAYHHLTRRGVAPVDLLPNMAAGICLLFTARAAMAGMGAAWIALGLAGALVAHAVDMRRRWRK